MYRCCVLCFVVVRSGDVTAIYSEDSKYDKRFYYEQATSCLLKPDNEREKARQHHRKTLTRG